MTKNNVATAGTAVLTYVPILATFDTNHLAQYGRRRRGDFPVAERVRCPRMGLSTLFPGSFGHQSPGIMTGAGGASLGWDRRRRVTPVSLFKLACDRFGKPVSAFPDHTPCRVPGNLA
jgi:hypothetical protein